MLSQPSHLPNVAAPMLELHTTQTVQDNDNYNSTSSELESLLDTTEFPLSARNHTTGGGPSQPHQQHLQRRRMTPQLARPKAADLSYEIGALKKIQERLERKREKLLTTYCTTRNLNGYN